MWLFATCPSVTANAQAAAANAGVKIDNSSFGPQSLTVLGGATVTWTNRDDIPDTIVSNDGVFKSKVRDTDEKFSYTFDKIGTNSCYCSLNPKMVARLWCSDDAHVPILAGTLPQSWRISITLPCKQTEIAASGFRSGRRFKPFLASFQLSQFRLAAYLSEDGSLSAAPCRLFPGLGSTPP